jgi:hypothetical protein
VLDCVNNNALFVLFIPSSKKIFNLSPQDKARDFAGEKVTVVGTFEEPTHLIHIQSIEVAP